MGRTSTSICWHVKAPRASVYRALLDAQAVARWKVPTGMTCHVHAFNPREGGSFRISLTYSAGWNRQDHRAQRHLSWALLKASGRHVAHRRVRRTARRRTRESTRAPQLSGVPQGVGGLENRG